MSFTAQDVAKLRQKTGAGMMECKSALTESNGDIEKAAEILRQKGLAAAAKKAEKTAADGIVASKISQDKKTGVILELNTQTDFVAKNELFLKLSQTVLDLILNQKPKNTDELLNLKISNQTVSDLVAQTIAQTGEKIQIKRFQVFNLSTSGVVGTYIHPVGNKIGVLTMLESSAVNEEIEKLAKDISMHIAAAQPQPEYIDRSQIPDDVIENEKRIELGKEDISSKPKEIAEKIVQGRLEKLLAQRCLLKQPFIKDQNTTIENLLNEKSKQLNAQIKISQFTRYNVGEVSDKTGEEQKSAVSV